MTNANTSKLLWIYIVNYLLVGTHFGIYFSCRENRLLPTPQNKTSIKGKLHASVAAP